MTTFATVQPVFVRQKDIPEVANNKPSVLEMCIAAERAGGQGTVLGAQEIRGLWRIYPATKQARTDILLKGIRIRDSAVQVSNANPFILREDSGEEKPSTKVWLDNIPLSVADSEIEHSLVKAGCELRSAIKLERARDTDHKLTRFLTGRRFVFITVPSSPLEKQLKVSIFIAKVYHKEQKLINKPLVCSRCLQQGHHVSVCKNDVVCRECTKPGHKRGDAACKFADECTDRQTSQQKQQDSYEVQTDTDKQSGQPDNSKKSADHRSNKTAVGNDRSRNNTRQSTLLSSLELHPRRRSETPKRGRSKERRSPREGTEKYRCLHRDDQRSDSPSASDCEHGTERIRGSDWG